MCNPLLNLAVQTEVLWYIEESYMFHSSAQ